MKRKYANTRRKKALLWVSVLLLSILLYYFASGYCLTPAAALREVEELWLYERLEPVAYFDPFTFNGETYHPMLAENSDYLAVRLPWFQFATGWHEGSGASLPITPEQYNSGGSVETSYITAINDHRAFFYGKISDPNVASWELESTVTYLIPNYEGHVEEGDAVTVPITEQWVETDDARYFFFTIDTHAVWRQLGDQTNYSTTMHLYDADGDLLDSIDLGEQWSAFREE